MPKSRRPWRWNSFWSSKSEINASHYNLSMTKNYLK
jgi:hypothetical protein